MTWESRFWYVLFLTYIFAFSVILSSTETSELAFVVVLFTFFKRWIW